MNYTNFISLLALVLDLISVDVSTYSLAKNETAKEVNVNIKDKESNNSNSEDKAKEWLYHPRSSEAVEDFREQINRASFRLPFSLTKLAKSLNYGYDPVFSKENYEPFERRNKPVTLIAFRRNHILPRVLVAAPERNSLDVAEMQSPYNTVGQFWEDTLNAS